MKKSLCAIMALASVAALADTKLDTKVITASGFETSLSETSYNMLVLTGDEIRERGYKDLKEALSSLPNVSVAGTGMGTSVDVRGWGSKANQRVKVLVDGISINVVDTSHLATPISSIDIESIEQIEVIPGGGSVIYGDKASGGVINIITKANKSKPYASAYVKGGSFDHKSVGGGLGHRLTDRLFVNFNFSAVDEKGYQRADINESVNLNLGLNYALSDNQSLALNAGYFEKESRGSFKLSKKELDADRRFGGYTPPRSYGGRIMPEKWATNEPTKLATKKDVSLKYQHDLNEHFTAQISPFYSDFKNGTFTNKRQGVNVKTKTAFGLSTTHLGYEFYDDKGTRGQDHQAMLKSHSVYALESLDLGALGLDFGARYQKINYEMHRYSKGSDTNPFTGLKYDTGKSTKDALLDTKQSKSDVAANLIASFKLDDDNKIYAKIERAFALPEAFEITDKWDDKDPFEAVYGVNNIKKEQSMNYELGYKGLIADQYFSFAVFYTQTKDEIFINMPSGAPVVWQFYNIDKTERYGAEISLSQSLLDDSLELYQNIGFISAKAKEASKSETKGAMAGEKIPGVSPFNASLGVSYAPIRQLKLRGDYQYYSKTNWSFEKEFKSSGGKVASDNERKAYGLLNLGLSYLPTKNLSLSLDVKNVLGEKYNLSCDTSRGVTTCNPAAKQSYYAEFRYKY